MTAREVRAILGPPDDVIVEMLRDPEPRRPGVDDAKPRVTRETLWCYGTAGHRTFPTLGQVRFNPRGRVMLVRGSYPFLPPPDRRIIPEARLRKLMRLLNRLPDPEELHGREPYHPLPLIRAVNALQPLGKRRALLVIGEYVRVLMECSQEGWYSADGGSARLFPLMNVLFDSNPDIRTDPEWPAWHANERTHPVLLQDDIPLLLSFPHGGQTDRFYPQDLEPYRTYGRLRLRPLTPPAKPLSIIDRLDAASAWDRVGLEDERWREMKRHQAMDQLLRLIEPVYHTDADPYGHRIAPGADLDERWRTIVEEVGRLPIRWHPRRQTYVSGSRSGVRKQRRAPGGRRRNGAPQSG